MASCQFFLRFVSNRAAISVPHCTLHSVQTPPCFPASFCSCLPSPSCQISFLKNKADHVTFIRKNSLLVLLSEELKLSLLSVATKDLHLGLQPTPCQPCHTPLPHARPYVLDTLVCFTEKSKIVLSLWSVPVSSSGSF